MERQVVKLQVNCRIKSVYFNVPVKVCSKNFETPCVSSYYYRTVYTYNFSRQNIKYLYFKDDSALCFRYYSRIHRLIDDAHW